MSGRIEIFQGAGPYGGGCIFAICFTFPRGWRLTKDRASSDLYAFGCLGTVCKPNKTLILYFIFYNIYIYIYIYIHYTLYIHSSLLLRCSITGGVVGNESIEEYNREQGGDLKV